MTTSQRDEIASRNAGVPTVSVWADGTFVVHGARDAETCHLATSPAPVLHLNLETWEPVTFLPMQARVDLFEKIAALATVAAANDEGVAEADIEMLYDAAGTISRAGDAEAAQEIRNIADRYRVAIRLLPQGGGE